MRIILNPKQQWSVRLIAPVPINYSDTQSPLSIRQLLLCRVTLGKSFLQFSAMKMAHAPPGHHSVVGRPSAGGLCYPEYVVYRGEQVGTSWEYCTVLWERVIGILHMSDVLCFFKSCKFYTVFYWMLLSIELQYAFWVLSIAQSGEQIYFTFFIMCKSEEKETSRA